MGEVLNIIIPGSGPWGFRLAGGKDFNTPVHISKTTPSGKASQANIRERDVVLSINGMDTSNLKHLDAQNLVKETTQNLALKLRRGGGWVQPPTKPRQQFDFPSAPPPPMRRPEPAMPLRGPIAPSAQVVHRQFNSPVGLYSADNIADAFRGQVEGMGIQAGAVKHQYGNPAPFNPTETGTYKVLHAEPKGPMSARYMETAPGEEMQYGGYQNPRTQSRSFKMLQEMTAEEEAKAFSDSHFRGNFRSPIDEYEAYDSAPRGPQSRSFRMLQQMTADEEAMMNE